MSICNYDILSNVRYADRFYYNILDEQLGPSLYICKTLYIGEDLVEEIKKIVGQDFSVYLKKVRDSLVNEIKEDS